MRQMSEAAKKRMQEAGAEFEKQCWRNEPYCELSVDQMFHEGFKAGFKDPDANKELLEEMESFLEDMTSGSVSLKFSTSEGAKLLQKIREARK